MTDFWQIRESWMTIRDKIMGAAAAERAGSGRERARSPDARACHAIFSRPSPD
ncbi:hypothetical protein [Paracoccus sphaerophysae]|uniref:hypothetical protein n=1 Tax=Paracoccus sphaerophysae TaxID=690417 RepID=UPI000A699A27|nr:hypothetical protein [Paracoccus sphaerophysae]